MTPDQQQEPAMEPIISSTTARIAVALFLGLFTLAVALLLWSELHPSPDGANWVDRTLETIDQFSMFTAILLVLYLVFAARLYVKRTEEYLELTYLRGVSRGRQQAADQINEGRYQLWVAWMEWKEKAEAARRKGRPEPNPPPKPVPGS